MPLSQPPRLKRRWLRLAAMALLLPAGAGADSASTLFLARRGWHVDVGFDVVDLEPELKAVADRVPGTRFLFLGFGDRHYVLSKHHGSSTLLSALYPGKGIILVTALRAPPADAFGGGHVIELHATPAELRAAQEFVSETLRPADVARSNRSAESYAAGPYPGSFYLEASARYSAFHTCNTWVEEDLRAAGIPIRGGHVIFAGQIWSRAERLAQSGR